ncbi:MAG: hypothetical protein HQ567_25555 [Candidatus Nealsonbacteria bacterium]|nr:hypothetical protein [Candidatus Nealsonbacteria bacterium]
MRCSRWCRVAAACIIAGWLAMAAGSSDAAEEARRFLDGLRELGYYDTALDYLDYARNDSAVDKEFKDVIDYEAGLTLIEAARRGRQTSIREQHLGDARTRFAKFLAEHAEHPLAASANTQLANLLVERGRIKVEQAASDNRSPAEKKQLLEDGRALYREAEKVFDALEKKFVAALKKFPKLIPDTEKKLIDEREQVRKDLLQSRLALASVLYEISKTYEPGSADRKKMLIAAAEMYAKWYDMYSTLLAGLYAHMWEARCYKELAPSDKTYWEKAFGCYEDLLDQPDDPQPFRDLKNKTLILFLETAQENKAPKVLQDAIAKYRAWTKAARPNEESSADGLALRFNGGDTILQYVKTLEQDKAKEKADLLRVAKIAFIHVTDHPGEFQRQARARLRLPEFAGDEGPDTDPTNFAEACDLAKDALDRTQDEGLPEEEVAKFRADAIRLYRLAMKMRPADVDPEEINTIRYYLTFLYWASGDLYESAVMGGFLARKYPAGTGARQGARICMAAWLTVYNDARRRLKAAQASQDGADPEAIDRIEAEIKFVNAQMVDIAKHTANTWPGEPEAEEAWGMLIRTSLIEDQLDAAREYLGKMGAESPKRGEMQLMVGQRIWSNYLAKSKMPEDDENPPDPATLDKLVVDARTTLEEGVARMRKPVDDGGGEITYTLAASVLSLAQIGLGSGQPDKAIQWLEDEKIGALTLVKAGSAATERGKFREQTYKTALRAYVAVQKLKEAEEAMNLLEELVKQSGDADAAKTLTKTYISLGRELQDQLERLRKEKKTAEMEKVAGGFELFLDNILKREEGNTFSSLHWVAETYRGMATEFDRPGSKTPEQAKVYYGKANAAYDTIFKLMKDKKIEAPAGAVDSINIRKAKCLRRLGRYMDALAIIKAILRERNMVLEAQLEGAYTYQDWGREKSLGYDVAIKGKYETKGKEKYFYVIWGWGKLAKRVIRSKPHKAIFHEARYNLALCRFNMALNPPDKYKNKKSDLLAQAEKDVLIIQKLFPDMGGPQWQPKYNELLKDIQETQGKKRTGLKKQ